MKEISIKDFEGIHIGQAEDLDAATGVTVVWSENGFNAGLDVRGGGPALRESGLLDPLTNEHAIHAVVLAGGSAFGLDAAGGVQKYLEERGIGYDVGVTRVPLVCQADIFDLSVGRADVRPNPAMAYQACVNSEADNYRDGSVGAGTGATIGKYFGLKRCTKSGIGSYAVQMGNFKIGALVVVNAFGDVYENGRQIAGLRGADGTGLCSTLETMFDSVSLPENMFVGNTTLGIILTNAVFDKKALCKIASVANNGYACSIRPVNTNADGDCIFALSCGNEKVSADLAGAAAAEVMSKAVVRAIKNAESLCGIPAYRDL